MLYASSPPSPGSCVGLLDWSATDVASSQSAMAGVLAGFVFGGLIVVVSVRIASRTNEVASALKLLFCAFFGLVVVAYLFADLAGDKNCLRAVSEETISGAILGTFAIVMIVSLSWLTVAYEVHTNGVLRFLRHLIYVASGFVVLLLCTSSYSDLQAEVPHGPSVMMIVLFYIVGGLLYFLALPLGIRLTAWPAALIRRMNKGMFHWPEFAVARFLAMSRDPVGLCVWAALGYLGVAAATDGVVLGSSGGLWGHPQVFVAYVVAWSSLLLSLGVLTLALRALAPDDPGPGNTNAE